MNEKDIEKDMIEFITKKEHKFQISKLDYGKPKKNIVKDILNELERVTTNENTEN